jgi:hypothetical protein
LDEGIPHAPPDPRDEQTTRSHDLRYLLMIYMNPTVFETLTRQDGAEPGRRAGSG